LDATVLKATYHDIAKYVGVVLGCNNFEVLDLGYGSQRGKFLMSLKKEACIIGLSA